VVVFSLCKLVLDNSHPCFPLRLPVVVKRLTVSTWVVWQDAHRANKTPLVKWQECTVLGKVKLVLHNRQVHWLLVVRNLQQVKLVLHKRRSVQRQRKLVERPQLKRPLHRLVAEKQPTVDQLRDLVVLLKEIKIGDITPDGKPSALSNYHRWEADHG
jgi:hypothetical protein